jgi:peptidoglycan/LPS O-acetylase OafA/YrhL
LRVVEATRNTVDVLLLFRGFACLNVVLCHVIGGFQPGVRLVSVGGLDLTWLIRTTGALGVWLFFILSGYLMGKGFYTKRYSPTVRSSGKFYLNRFLRIYPLYVFSIFAVWAINFRTFPVNAATLRTLLDLLCFSYYGNTAFPNSLLWTISTEFRFYLLVPFVFIAAGLLVKDIRSFVAVMVAILLAGIAYRYDIYLRYFAGNDFYVQWIHRAYIPLKGDLDMFLSGFVLNYLVQQRKARKHTSLIAGRLRKLAALFVFAVMLVFYNFISYRAQLFLAPVYSPIFFIFMQTIVILSSCFLIYQFETKSNYRVPAIQWSHLIKNPLRSLEIFGVLTYGIYIWHMAVMDTFVDLHLKIENSRHLFFAELVYTLLLSTIVSAITYFLVEKPFHRIRKA